MSDAAQAMIAPPARPKPDHSIRHALKTQFQVFHALMLHDIKSRFFGNGLGYIVTILWPAAHIAIIVAIFYFVGHPAPYGGDRLLYASIGVLPYIIWSYISRFTMLGIIQNRSFLQYPLIKPLDLMFARQILELVSCTIIVAGLFVFLSACGSDPVPHRIDEAFFALLTAAFLGIGFGVLGTVIVMVFPLFNIIYVGILLIAWATSGLVVNAEAMPAQVGDILAWNPLLHSVEWMRYAYYDDYPARLLDRTYVLVVAAGSLAIGLILERVLRPLTTR